MRLGLISDTHGHEQLTRQAVRMLESLGVDALLHCGDIGSPEIVEMLAAWRPYYVFGNCDIDRQPLRDAIARWGGVCCEEFADLTLAGERVALLHSHDRQKFRQVIQSDSYALVCYGHTHTAAIDRHGETLVVNPGAIYRANPHSIGLVELPGLDAQIISL
ncbi:Phosphodiesterase YfcE [Pirellulimonas nuda]|uniref:Phosphoesterase n=1 Tax=Pirellulimonas nuda TaxID=2528009 RepID=A0A518DGL0_9BACT|nr:YfcE family phosphodiesterase [Pirellulimonas nuda]QDU90572.1 Phosphodiesterase YfcE [Pirellulimonas nuda]